MLEEVLNMKRTSKLFCLLIAVLMMFTLSVTAFAANGLLNRIFPANTSESILNMGTVSAGIAVALAVVVYVISLLLIKGVAREDVTVLPKGEKIAKTLEKYGLLG
jgi:stage V sporulation protein B